MAQPGISSAMVLYRRLMHAGAYNHAAGVRLIVEALPASPAAHELLEAIASAQQALSSRDLCTRLGRTRRTDLFDIATQLKTLMDEGLLRRTYRGVCGKDGRFYYHLSPLGRAVMAQEKE